MPAQLPAENLRRPHFYYMVNFPINSMLMRFFFFFFEKTIHFGISSAQVVTKNVCLSTTDLYVLHRQE